MHAPDRVLYGASVIRRQRATLGDMEKRALFLIRYANQHAPVTVRQLFYAAAVAGVPGIEKDDAGYVKVQRQVLDLRRCGRIPYSAIADSTRWMRRPRMHNSVADALASTAAFYRRNLWLDQPEQVEIWVEKDALAGVIYPVTEEYGVPLMVCKGFSSETFAFEAAESYAQDGRPVHVYHLGDFDRSGVDAAKDLERKLTGFAAGSGVAVHFHQLAVTPFQIEAYGLATRPAKRGTAADGRWPYPFAVELDAIEPGTLRGIVAEALSVHMPDTELQALKVAEESERAALQRFVELAVA